MHLFRNRIVILMLRGIFGLGRHVFEAQRRAVFVAGDRLRHRVPESGCAHGGDDGKVAADSGDGEVAADSGDGAADGTEAHFGFDRLERGRMIGIDRRVMLCPLRRQTCDLGIERFIRRVGVGVRAGRGVGGSGACVTSRPVAARWSNRVSSAAARRMPRWR